MTTRNVRPSRRRLTTFPNDSLGTALTRYSQGRRRSPDRERQEEVDDVDGHDGEADRPADRDADAGRAAGGVVAVVAVRQDDDHREDEHLEERPDDVARRQEQMEVVRVGAG